MIPTLKSIFNTNQVTSLINLLTKNVTDLISGKEDVANKQNSLATDVTNTKYPTVTAVKAGLNSVTSGITLNTVLTNGNLSELDAGVKTIKLFDEANQDYGEINIIDGVLSITNAYNDILINLDGPILSLYTNTLISSTALTSPRTFSLPNKNGTFAMIDDVTTSAATKLDKFNTANNNNDLGNVYSGTLNGETGTILFTGNINANDYAVFTVGNSSCTTASRITDLYIITTITGYDISIMNYTPLSNEFRVSIKNNSAAPIAGFRLSFRVNN